MGKHAGHSPDRPAIQVSRGQWMVAVHFGAVRGTKSGPGAAGLVEDLGGKIRWGNHGNKAVLAGHLT